MMLAYNLFLLFKMDFPHVSTRCFCVNLPKKIISDARICECGSQKITHDGGNDAKLKTRLSKSSPFAVKMLVEFIRRGISDIVKFIQILGVI